MSNILLAGPWIGEFGWELFCWQGYIRKISHNYDRTIIIGRPNHQILYEDFCDEYIEFDPGSWATDGWRCHNHKSTKGLELNIKHTTYLNGMFDIGYLSDDKTTFFNEQEFVKYKSNTMNKKYDILFHCRNKETGSDRNWNIDKWKKLFDLLPNSLNIACIGNDRAFYIDGCDDLRGIALSDTVSVMSNSSLIVGPSSGPMHLASLCGLKHLVWSSPYNYNRYTKDWNPFSTEVIFYDSEDWTPRVKSILNLILKNL